MLSFALLIQCVPRKGFESTDCDTTYKHFLSIPLKCTQTADTNIVGNRKQNTIF